MPGSRQLHSDRLPPTRPPSSAAGRYSNRVDDRGARAPVFADEKKCNLGRTRTDAAAPIKAESRAEDYEAEICSKHGHFTLVRNGICVKCDTCGGTTGGIFAAPGGCGDQA